MSHSSQFSSLYSTTELPSAIEFFDSAGLPCGSATQEISTDNAFSFPFATDASSDFPFVLAGNDLAGDVVSNRLNVEGIAVLRSFKGSYHALVDLYVGRSDAALVHLYDLKTNTYNTPYIQRIAPGLPVVVFRLLKRRQGLVVRHGNPKKLSTWGSLLREGITLANRKRGCGARILLDEKLMALEADPWMIRGYDREFSSERAVLDAVENTAADVGISTEQAVAQVHSVDFVPMQTEWLDLVVAKNARTRTLVAGIKELLSRPSFRDDLTRTTQCDISSLGAITFEC